MQTKYDRSIADIAMIVWAISIFVTINGVGGNKFLPILIIIAESIIFSALRTGKKLFVFLMGHIAMIVAGAYISLMLVGNIAGTIVVIGIGILSMASRMFQGWNRCIIPGIGHIVIIVVCFMVRAYLGDKGTCTILYLMLAAYILLKVFYENIVSTTAFIINRRPSTVINEKKLVRTNLGITGIYTAILGAVLLCISIFDLEDMTSELLGLLKRLFRALFGFLRGQGAAQLLEPEQNVVQQQFDIGSYMPVVKEPGFLAKLLDRLVQILGVGLLIGLVIFIIVSTSLAVYRYFNNNSEKSKEINEDTAFIERNIIKRKEKRTGKVPLFHPARKLRRLYKKEVESIWKKKRIPEALSPQEELKEVGDTNADRYDDVRAIYEKARYSQHEITQQDVDAFSEAINEINRIHQKK